MTKRKDPRIPHGNRTHGLSHSYTYFVWQGMKDRCLNPRATGYQNYGGRGIKVCARWRASFENFFTDMGAAPRGKSIERENNNGNYEPSNCVWATRATQNDNQRRTRRITWNGETHTLKEWASRLGGTHSALTGRLHQGWSEHDAIATPFNDPWLERARRKGSLSITYRGETKTTTEWARITGIRRSTLQYRLGAGWPPETILTRDVDHNNRVAVSKTKT